VEPRLRVRKRLLLRMGLKRRLSMKKMNKFTI
jgi:hypothetical protein